jgi:hypothetical protein
MKGLIISGVLMSLVLLLTASPNLAKQFQVVILMSVFASLLPYMYAIIALPIIMIVKNQNRGSSFIFYCVLTLIGIIYSVFALLGSGTDSIFWGTVIMAVTIPLFSFVIAGQHKKGEANLHLDN